MKRLEKPSLAAPLFKDCEDTMAWSCLQGIMGEILVSDNDAVGQECPGYGQEGAPRSACAHLASFYIFAGEPDGELLDEWQKVYHEEREGDYVILVPHGKAWEKRMEEKLTGAGKSVRYAIKKGTEFDRGYLKKLVSLLPAEMEIRKIDSALYERCRTEKWSANFVRSFDSKEDFLKKAVGVVCLKDGEILAGCSTYSRYKDGIEVEVDTRKDQRRKHLATSCAAALILECLDCGLYPSWDAMNRESVGLAEKLGYEFSHEYPIYTFG